MDLESHEAAAIFPLMTDAEYEAHKASIAANGLKYPIRLHEGKILDGRHRYRACLELNVEPRFEEWDGVGSPVDFVICSNLDRRHLNESQRAMVASRAKPHYEEEARQRQATSTGGAKPQLTANWPEAEKGEAREKVAERFNVGPRSVERAARVLKDGVPELVKGVDDGNISVSAAVEVAALPPEEQRMIVAVGPEMVVAKAAGLRFDRENKYRLTPERRQDEGTAPSRIESSSADAQCHRMIGLFYNVFEVIRQDGGISAYTSNWNARQKKALLLQWINDRKQLDTFIKELEGEIS